MPASVPTGTTFDTLSGTAYVLENGQDSVAWLTIPEDPGAPAVVERMSLPNGDAGHNLNPVEVQVLPGVRELVVTMSSSVTSGIGGHLDVLRLDDTGRLAYDRSIPAAERTRGVAIDLTTGRLFVSEVAEGAVAAYAADQPSAPPPPPTTIAQAMPGPLSVSFAPADVVRTVGMSLLVLFLVGAPTPLFNETLETHLDEIQTGLSRRLGRRRRPTLDEAANGDATGDDAAVDAAGEDEPRPAVAEMVRRWSTSIWGVVAYLLVAAFLYSLLTPGFPGTDALLVFGVAIVGLVVATVADILPGDRYVLSRYRTHGTFRVALWTLALAAVCVAISRMANLQPGYMYGIIGTFTFGLALSRSDEGSMEATGRSRPARPGARDLVRAHPLRADTGRAPDGPHAHHQHGSREHIRGRGGGPRVRARPHPLPARPEDLRLEPLAMGPPVGRRSRPVRPRADVSGHACSAEPGPATLATTLVSAGLYGAIAVGFWAAFRYRAARHEVPREDPGPSAG